MIRRFLALAAVAVALAACTSGNAADATADGVGGELQATHWILDSYSVDGALTIVPPDQYADADFRANRVKGFAGCSDYDAVYVSNGRRINIGFPLTTLMSCGETADAFQSSFITLLLQSRYYNVRGDTLTLRAADLSIVLVFEAAPNNPLLGSWIIGSYATTPGSVSAPIAGTELTAVFRLKTVSGSSGCNTYQGPYTTNGTVVAIGPLATTQKACPEDVMTQEQAVLAALTGVGRLDQRGADQMNLEDLSGTTLLILVRPSAVEPSPGPSASASPSATPAATSTSSPSPSPSPTATPTTAPTATPAATSAPTATPAASASPAPTVVPPASLPPTATCQLTIPSSVSINVVYPATWFTTTTPADIACQYFDPAAITVPADPATLKTAVMIKADPAATYQDALTAATDPADWDVLTNEPVTIGGLPATRLQATATISTPEVSAGATRYGYLIDAAGHPLWIETTGTVGDPTFTTNMSVVDLIASQSTLTPTP
ncbi:MAG TPA: META domain-containing protein [Candidatus Limnocylindrales bacterium]|nr:META domain-containing protein [Candidatus Limnocylindrales bacterium]